jgi:phosphatidylglycerophosphate synthase
LFAGLLFAVERGLVAHHPHPRLGTANRITLFRAAIACLIAARAVEPAPLGAPERWLLAAISVAALMLDGADGWAARRQGLASAFGARFDLEVDAFAILVLAITVAKAQAVPCWVLAIGGMRYFYLAAALAFPLLRLAPATLRGWAAFSCAAALGLLAYSFAADIVILLSTRPHR